MGLKGINAGDSKDIFSKNNFVSFINNLKSVIGLGISLAKANFKSRNEGSYLGILWYLLDPLVTFIILLFIRGVIYKGNTENYPAYLLVGLIVFHFFRQATTNSTDAITGSSGLIKSVKIKYESLVLARVLQALYSHFFELLILFALLPLLNVPLYGIILYPIMLFFLLIFIMGIAFILSTIGAYVNDLNHVWRILTQLLWFLTPIFYYLPEGSNVSLANMLNPVFYFIDFSRTIILHGAMPSFIFMFKIACISFASFFIGAIIFKLFKKRFAETV